MSIAGLLLLGLFIYAFLSFAFYVSFHDFIATLFASCFTLPIAFGISLLLYVDANQREKEMELVSERLNVDQSEIIREDGQFYTSEGAYKVEFKQDAWALNFDEYTIEKIVKTGEIMELTE